MISCSNFIMHSARKFHFTACSNKFENLLKERIHPISMSFNIYESNKSDGTQKAPLIIMHGLFGSKSNWNSLSKAIHSQTERKVIAVDARNHGASPHSEQFSYYHLVEDLSSLFKTLSISKASIMGHSMGGRAMMLFALSYPELIEKLIVVDISHKSPGSQMMGMSKYFQAMRSVSLSDDLAMPDARKKANDQLTNFIPEVEVRQFLLTNLVKEKGTFKWRLNIDALEKAFGTEITEFPQVNSQFDKPTLFIGGTKSAYLRREDEEDIKKLFLKAKFKYLEAGHWVHAEKPNEFLDLVQMFLN